MEAVQLPTHLVPLEVEREFLAGAFRAAAMLQENPDHAAAKRALSTVLEFDPEDLCYPEHQAILGAMGAVQGLWGFLSPALVLTHLRSQNGVGAARLLPDLVDYGLAPVAGIEAHAEKLREASRARADYQRHQRSAAAILGGRRT